MLSNIIAYPILYSPLNQILPTTPCVTSTTNTISWLIDEVDYCSRSNSKGLYVHELLTTYSWQRRICRARIQQQEMRCLIHCCCFRLVNNTQQRLCQEIERDCEQCNTHRWAWVRSGSGCSTLQNIASCRTLGFDSGHL